MSSRKLAGKVCLVTGATRGIGKGIAVQLGEAGATVYITGRTLKPRAGSVGGSLEETAKEIDERGGNCIPVVCDHNNDESVLNLFAQIKRDQNGRLDVLVNNAYSAVNAIMKGMGKKFWELEPDMWDTVNNVGLRNHYYCTVYAARMMVEQKSGLIVTVSSMGGLRYLFNVPYGIGKEACDRMMADCGQELRKQNVACISLWPGAVKTEEIMNAVENDVFDGKKTQVTAEAFLKGETPEYAGKCIAALAADRDVISKTGRILIAGDLGDEYGFVDVNGEVPMNFRRIGHLMSLAGWPLSLLGSFMPGFLKIPRWMMALGGNKF